MPTPAEAMAILRRALPGLLPTAPDNGEPEYGDPTGSLDLADLRGQRERELETRLANDQFGAGSRAGVDSNTGRDAALLKFLQGERVNDPYTGTAARGRTQKVQDVLESAATTMRPEVGDAADTVAKRNAFAKFLGVGAEARAKDEEAISPAGTAAADAVSRRKVAEARAAHPDPYGGAAGTGGGGADSNTVAWWADQARGNPAILPKISDKGLRREVEHALAAGDNLNDVTAQSRRMGEVANKMLPLIDEVQREGKDLQAQGLFAPGIGWARRKLSEHGLGTVAGMSPELTQQAANFDSKVGYLRSAITQAHSGMRGAASPAVLQKFESLMQSTGDYPTFLGDLDSARELLTLYGNASPNTRPHAPADAGAAGAADPTAGFIVDRH